MSNRLQNLLFIVIIISQLFSPTLLADQQEKAATFETFASTIMIDSSDSSRHDAIGDDCHPVQPPHCSTANCAQLYIPSLQINVAHLEHLTGPIFTDLWSVQTIDHSPEKLPPIQIWF